MSTLITKFITDNAVTGAKIRLNNNEALRSLNQAGTASVDLLKLNATNNLELLLLPEVASTLPIPTGDKQLATIEYIKNYVIGKTDAKDAVNYLASTNVAGTFNAGNATTPATLTGTGSLVVDGKTFTSADVNATRPTRIGFTDQTAGLQNGIYDLTAVTNGISFTVTRSSDFDGLQNASGTEVTSGAWFRVINGTTHAGWEAMLTTPDPITINTTALTFVKYPTGTALTGGDMIVRNGSDLAVDLAPNGGLESSNPGNAAGQLRIKTSSAVPEQERTVSTDSNGNLVTPRSFRQEFTLVAADITNQYVDLTRVASIDTVDLVYPGQGEQTETVDFNVSYTGGASSKTRVTFAGGLATGGASALAAGEKIHIKYRAFGP